MTENRQLPKWGRQIANLLFQLSTIFGLLEGLQIKDCKVFFLLGNFNGISEHFYYITGS